MISKERLGVAIVLGASIAGLIVRLAYVGYKSVWLDEAVSAYVSTLRIADILIYAGRADYHPPLYYLILHMIPLNKYNEFYLRLPSVVVGALTVPASYYLGKVAFNQKVGIITACLVAFSPYLIYLSQEARMYPQLCLFVILSYAFLLRSLKTNSRMDWALYTASIVLALYTHYFAFFALFTQIVYVAYLRLAQKVAIASFLKTIIAAAILYIPWVPFAASSLSRGLVNYYYDRLGIFRMFNRFTLYGDIATSVRILVLCAFALLLLYSVYQIARKNDQAGICLLSSFLVIPVVIFLGFFGIHLWQIKYFIFLIPIYLVLIAYSLSKIKRRWIAPLLLILICSVSVVAVYPTYFQSAEDWRSASLYMHAHYLPGDVVTFDPSYYNVALNYYFGTNYLTSIQPTSTRIWLITPLCA